MHRPRNTTPWVILFSDILKLRVPMAIAAVRRLSDTKMKKKALKLLANAFSSQVNVGCSLSHTHSLSRTHTLCQPYLATGFNHLNESKSDEGGVRIESNGD